MALSQRAIASFLKEGPFQLQCQYAASEAAKQQADKQRFPLGIHGGGGEHQKVVPSLTESIPQSSVKAEVAPAGGDKPAGDNVDDPGKGQNNAQDQKGPDKPGPFSQPGKLGAGQHAACQDQGEPA